MSLSTNEQLGILLQANMLEYSPPIDGNLSNSRQLKKYAFSSLNYGAGGQPSIQINSGSDYISGPTSYIMMGMRFTGAVGKFNANAGECGSAFNLIKEFQIAHRSGDVIDRTDNLNALVGELIAYAFDSSYGSKFAEVFEYGLAANYAVNDFGVWAMPLFLFSGLFAQKALIPSQLLAGARIKMQLETAAIALVGADATYDSVNLDLVLDSIDLMDAVKKSLMVQASNTRTQGLQYPFYSWFQLRNTTANSQLNFDINFSAAKTMVLLIKTRLDASFVAAQNSMLSEIYKYKTWRVRIGSHTMPQHEVSDSQESYIITQEAFSANPDSDIMMPKAVQCGKGFNDYYAHPIICCSLEKNTIIDLSGEVTNGARMLNFTATYDDNAARTVDAYLKHLRVANCMIDNVVIDK